jgi:transposase-like protein
MSKIKRKFDLDEKLQVLREGETNGVEATCRKYQISRSLFYNWKNRFNRQGPDGLASRYYKTDPAIKALEKENERLRRIISKQALELQVKEELLKKTKLHYQ